MLQVDWVSGDVIVIATTGASAWETEVRTVTGVSADGKTLTLDSSLTYTHTGGSLFFYVRVVFSYTGCHAQGGTKVN